MESEGKSVGSYGPNKNATPLDAIKWDICREIIIFKQIMKFTPNEMSELMGVDKARTSEILHYRTQRFTLDRLLTCFISLQGHNKLTDTRINEIIAAFHSKRLAG